MSTINLHSLFLEFSNPTFEARYQQYVFSQRIRADVWWSLLLGVVFGILWPRVGVRWSFDYPLAFVASLLYTAVSVTPAITFYYFGKSTYLAQRRYIITAARVSRCITLLAVQCYRFPSPVLEVGIVDLVSGPVIVPLTFQQTFKDFLLTHFLVMLVMCYVYAGPVSYCHVIVSHPATRHLVPFFDNAGKLLNAWATLSDLYPCELSMTQQQHCSAIATFLAVVVGLLLPAMFFYVTEYLDRKTFAARASVLVGSCAAAEMLSSVLSAVAFLLAVTVWQLVAVFFGELSCGQPIDDSI